MDEPSAAYMACESRGFACRDENAWGAAGAVGKSPNVGDWGGAAKLNRDIMRRKR